MTSFRLDQRIRATDVFFLVVDELGAPKLEILFVECV